MSLTLLYRGKNVRFSMRLNKLYWFSVVLAFALFSTAIVYLILSRSEESNYNTGYLTSHDLTIPSNYLKKIVLKKQQITVLTIKLAELKSHVLRSGFLGERLAKSVHIPEQESSFDKLAAHVGPSLTTGDVNQKSFGQLLVEIAQLENLLAHQENKVEMLESLTLGLHIENTRYFSGRPITRGWLSSYHGVRKEPFNGRAAIHKGIDFAGKEDGDIISTASDVVSWADEIHGYLIAINHGDALKTRYAHNKNIHC
ncbi:hypothetical protein Q4506_10020 [Colwellia sp. 4_MG-2023]|uniref:M23 family metallopeptidase n=1 Tax=unclassified Colwellia TaxID=196834 RepID=UPI0026E1F813|nr:MULTISPECIES: peptidoglycan DD-metalloendopeptidase family protein [unclassified Colwellia]MDO6507185.1 hypothetical protein [Colwellia sp. 5_MG-2023]MDO6556021.1 hypothetical protein [Colwellia sp. 4_MG-2023]